MSKFKARFFLIITAINWGAFILLSLPFMLFALIYDLVTTPRNSWLKCVVLLQDLAANVVQGGHHKTYISSLLGYLKLTGSRGGTYAANVVDWIWLKIFKEENHCIGAMKAGDVYDFSARRAIAGTVVYWLSLYLIYLGVTAL